MGDRPGYQGAEVVEQELDCDQLFEVAQNGPTAAKPLTGENRWIDTKRYCVLRIALDVYLPHRTYRLPGLLAGRASKHFAAFLQRLMGSKKNKSRS
ncbi:MAG TPA: hypothetical protein VN633_04100 [Bryobacteraceae bacterium]|nr:hypothetical protein [Bryobacteraceae bacterium]